MENETGNLYTNAENSTAITDAESVTAIQGGNDNAEAPAVADKPKRRPGRPRKNPPKDLEITVVKTDEPVTTDSGSITTEEIKNTVLDSAESNEVKAEERTPIPEQPELSLLADNKDENLESDEIGVLGLESTAENTPSYTDINDTESLSAALLSREADINIPFEDTPDENDQVDSDEGTDDMYPLQIDAPSEIAETKQEPARENEEVEEELPPYDPDRPRKIDARFDLVELFIVTLALVMIISAFFFRHTIVDGASMEKTLYDQEHLIISDVFYEPKPGDIIVFADYTTAIKKNLVKRVIAVGGDRVKITREGQVIVNGKLLEEDYVNIDEPGYKYRPLEITVPEGELFVMGDHRNESVDSRDPYIGTISEDAVLGRVLIRIYPFSEFGAPDKKKDE